MEFRSLLPGELDRWAAHCAGVFGEAGHGVSKAYFLNHFHNDPWRDVNGIFVAVDGGSIVATVRVFRRKVWLMGDQVVMGGIGEVSTHPDYRGRGLAGSLLELSIDWMRREGMAVSLLFSDLSGFYGRHGWKSIPKPMKRFRCAPADLCTGRAAQPGDLPALMAVEEASTGSDWMVVRTPAYWEQWMPEALGKYVLATVNGNIVAWLAYAAHEDGMSIQEFRALPGFERKFDGLCALAAELDGRRGQPVFAPAWLKSAMEETETFSHTYSMVRLNTPFRAGGAVIDSTERLMETAGECRDSDLDHF